MKFADIKKLDVANGPGLRVSLFVSGCRHCCQGCFNKKAWDFNYGFEYSQAIEDYIISLLENESIRGITILGGEPLEPENQPQVAKLICRIKNELPNKDIWLYSGFTFEQIIADIMNEDIEKIIENIDVLVDGKFEKDKLNLNLRFRGSTNQRIIEFKH